MMKLKQKKKDSFQMKIWNLMQKKSKDYKLLKINYQEIPPNK